MRHITIYYCSLIAFCLLAACLPPSGGGAPTPTAQPTAPAIAPPVDQAAATTRPSDSPTAAAQPTEAIPIATPADFTGLPIRVDVADRVGDVAAIGGFLAVEGGPGALGYGEESDAYVHEAWRKVMVGVSELSLFDDTGAMGVKVRRNSAGGLDLDFTGLDSFAHDYFRGTLNTKDIYFSVSLMPLALSSNAADADAYYFYAPASYDEWYDVVYRTVLHIKDDLEMPGAAYMVWTEPETYFLWRGQPGRQPGDPAILNDYINLYVTTALAVKAADPAAKVGGPMTVTYTSTDYRQMTGWGMEEFLKALAAHNAAQPDDAAALDEVVWQDYEWTPGTRLAEGVAYLREILPQYGYPADTPQVIVGWNKQFTAGPIPCDTITSQQRAAYFAANIIEQLNPGGERGLARAYLWPFDDDRVCVNTALISVPMPERREYDYGGYDPTGGDPYTGGILPAITEYCLRPAYAAFQMLRAMRDGDGQFVRTTMSASPHLQAMAASNGAQVAFMIANNTDAEQPVTIAFTNLPFGGDSVVGTLQVVDDTHSADCNGLEAGIRSRLPLVEHRAEVSLRMAPWSVVLVTLAP
jgi:hypothetical protein